MKKTLTLAAAVAISTAALSANATDMYVKAGMGASSTKYKASTAGYTGGNVKKTAPTVMIGLGATVAPDTRVEATLDYTQFTKKLELKKEGSASLTATGKVKMYKLMLNAEYDIVEVTPGVKLYGAAGIGMAKVNLGKKKTKIAYTLGTGVNGKLADTMSWDLGYKFTHVTKYKSGVTGGNNIVSFKPSQHTVMASVKFHM